MAAARRVIGPFLRRRPGNTVGGKEETTMRPSRSLTAGIGALLCLLSGPQVDDAVARPSAVPTVVAPCTSAGAADLNGDGYSDAVVGDPDATVAGKAHAGRVVVLYGDADGRVGEGARSILTQASLGLPVEAGDQFGWSVATTQVDFDSCADVVVGAPGEDLSGRADAGSIHVVFGSTAGLDGDAAAVTLSQADVAGTVEAGDRFGATVAAGTNLGQDTSVVAAGAPGEDVSTASSAGAVNLVQFSDTHAVTPRQVSQDAPGVPGGAETGDRFGAAVALGVDVLRGDSSWELLAGAPGEALGSRTSAGSLTILSGVQGFPPDTWSGASFTQDSPGVPGAAEAGDEFGQSIGVTTTSFVVDGSLRRIAVGAPGEDVGSRDGAGLVNRFTADGTGLSSTTSVTQDTPGVGGGAETGDRFGQSVAVVSGTSHQLAVGVPGEDVGSTADAGIAQLFPWDDLAADSTFDQDSPGAAGAVHAGSRYGSPVAAVEGSSERVLAIGNPDNGTGTVHVVTLTGPSADRSWVPGTGGVPGGASRFGGAIGGYDDLH